MKYCLFGLCALFTVGSASAQSSVTIYGTVDVGVQHGQASGPGSDSMNRVASGLYNGSKIGFRGQEDLGGGMSATFVLEGQPPLAPFAGFGIGRAIAAGLAAAEVVLVMFRSCFTCMERR